MTPKKKAKQLYNDFAYEFVRCNVENASQKAKEAAIRCVDEILAIDKVEVDDNTGYVVIPVNMDTAGTFEKYWNEVKAEIYNVPPKNDMQCGVGKNNI